MNEDLKKILETDISFASYLGLTETQGLLLAKSDVMFVEAFSDFSAVTAETKEKVKKQVIQDIKTGMKNIEKSIEAIGHSTEASQEDKKTRIEDLSKLKQDADDILKEIKEQDDSVVYHKIFRWFARVIFAMSKFIALLSATMIPLALIGLATATTILPFGGIAFGSAVFSTFAISAMVAIAAKIIDKICSSKIDKADAVVIARRYFERLEEIITELKKKNISVTKVQK